jgi:hypothetical protein
VKRRAGSVRFDPYFKVQRWEPRSAVWIDVQRAYETPEDALRAAGLLAGKTRVMEIDEDGRRPLDGSVRGD